MSIRNDIQRTSFFNELNIDYQKKYFDLSKKKYLHNIDNIYYSCFIEFDSPDNNNIIMLIDKLKELKSVMMTTYEEVPYKYGLVYENKRHATYGLCLTCKDRFDVFFDEYYRNDKTPRVLIKIRSMPLWTEKMMDIIEDTFRTVELVLNDFNLRILGTRENRLDYAYHTNIIQNPRIHFSDINVEDTIVTSMEDYGVRGKIKRQFNKTKLTKDYLCFGSRKSNGVFCRIYNKTREVIENGYKAYFISIWYDKKLINYYDKYCLEYAFECTNYDKIHKARLLFYLKYGKNEKLKLDINSLLNYRETTLQDIEKLADSLMPKVTIINNIEFETKRKYYYSSDNHINYCYVINEKHKLVDERLHRLFKIIDNRKEFINNITLNIIRFEKNQKICYWWSRLRACKIKDINKTNELVREYNKNLNEKIVKRKLINNVATLSVYNKGTEKEFIEDIADVLSNLNDNDTRYKIIDEFGCLDDIESKLLDDYNNIKDKKNRLLKNRLNNSKV